MTYCILISDTQIASRRMLRFAMDLKGCEVIECADADGVMSLLAKRRVDILLLSLYPRDVEGYAVLEKLNEHYSPEALPVILIGDTVLRAEYAVLGWRGTAWLDRPFRVSELMSLVDSILNLPVSSSGKQADPS